MTPKVRVEERDWLLDDITIAPAKPADRYATAPVDRYASAPVDRYASAPVTDRYASLDRYAAAAAETVDAKPAVDRYNRKDRYAGKVRRAGRALHRTLVLLIPPLSGDRKGQLLAIQSSEFERCYEEADDDDVWRLGYLVDFDDCAQSAEYTWGGDGEDNDYHLIGAVYDNEQDTFQEDGWWMWERPATDDLIRMALELRAVLADLPDLVVEHLYPPDLFALQVMVGMRRRPEPMEVHDAILADPRHGLGGAALDYAVWRQPEAHGNIGEAFAELMSQVEQTEYIRRDPVETFLLHISHLNSTTEQQSSPHTGELEWVMRGQYVVADITYTSDLTGEVPCGWRSVWLEPKS